MGEKGKSEFVLSYKMMLSDNMQLLLFLIVTYFMTIVHFSLKL
jgi:hypothetical protein